MIGLDEPNHERLKETVAELVAQRMKTRWDGYRFQNKYFVPITDPGRFVKLSYIGHQLLIGV